MSKSMKIDQLPPSDLDNLKFGVHAQVSFDAFSKDTPAGGTPETPWRVCQYAQKGPEAQPAANPGVDFWHNPNSARDGISRSH